MPEYEPARVYSYDGYKQVRLDFLRAQAMLGQHPHPRTRRSVHTRTWLSRWAWLRRLWPFK